MKKLLTLLLIIPLFLACASDDENEIIPERIYKYKYVIYNDKRYNGTDIYDVSIINQIYDKDLKEKTSDIQSIKDIKYGEKSDTIRTNGYIVFFTHYHKDKNGVEQFGGIKSGIFLKENYPNVISISGFNDDRK